MKTTKLLVICICCLVVAPAWGQAANRAADQGILGYLDPHTGAFRPVPLAAEESPDSAALATFSGTITVTLTITVKSLSHPTIVCSAAVSVLDDAGVSPRVYSESATVDTTTNTCVVTIPYSWALATHASDTMCTRYSVSGTSGVDIFATRSSSLTPLDTRKVPANGAITALTAAATI